MSQGEQIEPKRPRGGRLSPPASRLKQGHLPSPVTNKESTASDDFHEGTVSPPENGHKTPQSQAVRSPKGPAGLSSPPNDTQAFSQFVYPPVNRTYAVEDEEGEEVWGYLVPMDDDMGKVMILRRREACPVNSSMVGRTNGREKVSKGEYKDQEERYEEEKKENGIAAGGYLIGRHRECGK